MKERYASRGYKNAGKDWIKLYEGPSDMDCAFVTGFMVTNTTDRNTTVESYIERNKVPFYLTAANTPLPAGSACAIAALGQRLQVFPGEAIYVRCGHDAAADIFLSISEILELNR